jgi:Flp pilus assembly protein TadG
MFKWLTIVHRIVASGFLRRADGSALPLFALSVIPIFGLIGAGIDYSRASNIRTELQVALDSAVLAGAKDGSPNWANVALNFFNASPPHPGNVVGTPSFTIGQDGNYSGTVSATVPTSVLGVLGLTSIAVSATSIVSPASGVDNSCILTLDHAAALSDGSMTFNGAPAVSLSGCGLRSNTSMTCNGHSGGATASIAAGSVSGCNNAESNAAVVPDIYAPLASSITAQCSPGSTTGAIWDVSSSKPPAGLIAVSQTYGTEYHVCGDLTLTGTGYLPGSAPTSDTIIVIENGGLIMASDAAVSTMRVTFVLTGTSTNASAITFPNGKGHAASLSLSPSTTAGDPWQGISLYQDPRQTTDASDDWGPGATFNADGVVYLPYANVTMHGSGASNNSKCTKIVADTFTTNGSVALNFSQSNGCTTLGVKQWTPVPIHLAQ